VHRTAFVFPFATSHNLIMRRIFAGFAVLACLIAQDKKLDKKPYLPLKPERKIEFTVDEGSWLSLSVSPDGKTILFDLLGDLYTVPISGGEATRITSGLPFDSQPTFSPDGKLVAFTSDRDGSDNLWIAKADGSDPKQLSKDKDGDFISPSWTPDGEYVLVSRNQQGLGTHEIWMYNIPWRLGRASHQDDSSRLDACQYDAAAAPQFPGWRCFARWQVLLLRPPHRQLQLQRHFPALANSAP
jgi:WD40 repeat protein